ncbi:MAG: TonB-dependent receptor [Alistipes sp.]|nr:TonB-dependent receptor [Alistipes sp.]
MISQGEYYNPLVEVYTYPRGENFADARLYEVYDPMYEWAVQNWKWGAQRENMQNPYWILHRNAMTNDRQRYMFNLSLKYKINDWMDVTARGRSDVSNGTSKHKIHASTLPLFAGEFGKYREIKTEDRVRYGDLLFNMQKSWDKFSLYANVGGSIQDTYARVIGATGNLLQYPNFFAIQNIDTSTGQGYLESEKVRTQVQSVFANLEMGWNNMLFLTTTGRIDWASQMANTGKNYFMYPSVGLSAVVSEMVDLPEFISFMKLRGSWASVGLPIPVGSSIITYPYVLAESKYRKSNKQYYSYKAEKTDSWEIGMQIHFLRNRLTLDATYYKSNTYNQTFEITNSSSAGTGSILVIQTGDVQNKGLELSLGFNDRWGDFSWDTNLNASHNKNKILQLANDYPIIRD